MSLHIFCCFVSKDNIIRVHQQSLVNQIFTPKRLSTDIVGEVNDDLISCCIDGLADIENIFLLQVG